MSDTLVPTPAHRAAPGQNAPLKDSGFHVVPAISTLSTPVEQDHLRGRSDFPHLPSADHASSKLPNVTHHLALYRDSDPATTANHSLPPPPLNGADKPGSSPVQNSYHQRPSSPELAGSNAEPKRSSAEGVNGPLISKNEQSTASASLSSDDPTEANNKGRYVLMPVEFDVSDIRTRVKTTGVRAPHTSTNGTAEKTHQRLPRPDSLTPSPVVSGLDVPSPLSEEGGPRGKRSTPSSIRPRFASPPWTTSGILRPKASIPPHLSPEEYARQCIIAAYSSRLNPFALHPEEHRMLREHINHQQVTTYLNIRNGVLRLWTRNPLVSVTREEAAGCARDYRWLQVAEVAHEWLVRRGYINFGCAEMVGSFHVKAPHPSPEHVSRRQTIVVIGAGMAGLGCARQLQGLFTQLAHRWVSRGEQVPRVVVLEGRNRVGGRIYSHPVHTQVPDQRHPTLRCTADMGAQIITGFEHGNPLNAVIRGQLGLHYHPLKDNSILHDSDGAVVDKDRDQWVEKLFNDILEHASRYRHKIPTLQTVEGDKDLIELGKDPTGEGGKRISVVEDAAATIPLVGTGSLSTRLGSDEPAVIGDDRIRNVPTRSTLPPQPPHSVTSPPFDLDASVKSSEPPTLGVIMDDAVKQCQGSLGLKAQDLRLLNWHFANLEYANAANVNDLSLEGWDQDIGNEFEGAHAVVIGGYLQVPRGLWQCPSPLDLRRHKVVARVTAVAHPTTGSSGMTVTCQDGEVFQADHVVSTLPLGVMKAQAVQFEPPLPSWKTGCIDRLGFGTLNKVVLIYEQAFWDEDRDMFGLLRDPTVDGSLDQADYAEKRGRFYLFWNCIKTSGCPMLVALMAGDAAYQTEAGADHEIICEATKVLATMFTGTLVPAPSEVIISRWCKDRFARGTYSYMGPRALPEDYDLMAKPVGNLHFAGEATCGTHPATVHGAYLSGLRAAHEVVGSLLGPIHVPTPLVAPKIQSESPSKMTGEKRKVADAAWQGAERMREAREKEVAMAVLERIGERPVQGERSTANPYLLYQKDNWHLCKDRCDEARRRATKNPVAKATRNEVRAALGQMWRDAPVEEKQPYLEHSSSNKQRNSVNDTHFKARLLEWDRKADEIRREHLARLSQQSDGSPSKKMRATVAPPDHLRPLREI